MNRSQDIVMTLIVLFLFSLIPLGIFLAFYTEVWEWLILSAVGFIIFMAG